MLQGWLNSNQRAITDNRRKLVTLSQAPFRGTKPLPLWWEGLMGIIDRLPVPSPVLGWKSGHKLKSES